MRTPLVAGNWKMNGSRALAGQLGGALSEAASSGLAAELAVCPPFPYLEVLRDALADSPCRLGAQDVCERPDGAFTGEVSADMLADVGCRYVLVGHSERRALFGDTDARVAAKFGRAVEAGLTPVLCVGETLEEREAERTEAVVGRQLMSVVAYAGTAAFRDAVIAYEPVWAIGTGHTATAGQAQEMHRWIRQRLAAEDATIADHIRIVYGGSVKAANAAELFAGPDVDGGLIGGASLKSDEFLAICRAAG